MTRLPQIDALRGFALCGIVVANVQWFSGYAVDPASTKDALGLDTAITAALHVLVDGKFYGLFSLLFGASFALMIDRARARGRDAPRLVRQRLMSLGLLGLGHAILLWFGDIMSLYAVAAIPVWWLLRLDAKRASRWSLALLLAPAAWSALLLAIADDVAAPALVYGPLGKLGAFGSGSLGALLDANAAFLAQRWLLALASGRLFRLLGLFVLGGLLVRHRPVVSPRTWTTLAVTAIGSNIALGFVSHAHPLPPSPLGVVRSLLECVAIPSGALLYAGLGWRLFSRRGRITRAFEAAGRLSLTHYLGQSIAMAGLFYGVGFGLWGDLGATESVAVALGLVGAQVAISPDLLTRFGLGPGERALRWLSG